MVKFQQKQVKGGEIMEQILNKLSEIETTARRIMEDADRTKAALSSEMEQQCRDFDAALEQKTNLKIQELRNSLEKQKDQELSLLRQQTEKALIDLDAYYRQNHQQLSDERSDAIWEISFPTAESPPRSAPCRAS